MSTAEVPASFGPLLRQYRIAAGLSPDITLPPDLRAGVANSATEIRQRVREILHRGADFIKIIATGAVLTRGTKPGVSEYTEDEIRAAVEEAAKYGAKVTAHAHGAEGIKNAVRAGVPEVDYTLATIGGDWTEYVSAFR